MYKPNYRATSFLVDVMTDINNLLRQHPPTSGQGAALLLRKANRIRSIRSSLAIEGNSLSLAEVGEVLEGHPVLAPDRQIMEVQNAAEAYSHFEEYDPCSEADLLRAHGLMMRDLLTTPGQYRKVAVYVVNSYTGQTLHEGLPAEQVGSQMQALFEWLRSSSEPPLLKACIFHQRLEDIHPFADGNGRMGRLWQSVILNAIHPVFASLPVESIVHDNVKTYYATLLSSEQGEHDVTLFVEFMLAALREALRYRLNERPHLAPSMTAALEALCSNGTVIVGEMLRNPKVTTAELSKVCGVSVRTIMRQIDTLRATGYVERTGGNRVGQWKVNLPGPTAPWTAP